MPDIYPFLYVDLPVPDGLLHNMLAAGVYGDVRIQKSTLRETIARNLTPEWDIDVIAPAELAGRLKTYKGQKVIVWPANVAMLEVGRFKLLLDKVLFAQYPVDIEVGAARVYGGDAAFYDDNDWALKLVEETYLVALDSMADLQRLFSVNIHSRYFNDVVASGETIVKKSSNIKKIHAEYTFLSTVPEQLQAFFVPVRNYEEHEGWAAYTMPKLPLLDASVRYINGNLRGRVLETFLRDVGEYLSVAEAMRKPATADTYAFIADKCLTRFEELREWEHFTQLEAFVQAHTEFDSVDAVFQQLMSLLKRYKKDLMAAGQVFSHGDLCLSNMLYDETAGLLQLIDPRGGLATESYRSPYYDLAKLSHSLLGGYDHIINGVAGVAFDEVMRAKLVLGIDAMDDVRDAFVEMVEANGRSLKLVRLVEASLFLSMLPLHTENIRKVHLLALRGIEILRDVQQLET